MPRTEEAWLARECETSADDTVPYPCVGAGECPGRQLEDVTRRTPVHGMERPATEALPHVDDTPPLVKPYEVKVLEYENIRDRDAFRTVPYEQETSRETSDHGAGREADERLEDPAFAREDRLPGRVHGERRRTQTLHSRTSRPQRPRR